jgi:hypothetical protein
MLWCGTFTVRHHNTWIFEDAAEVMLMHTSVLITDVDNKAIYNKKLGYGIDQIQNLPLLW